MTGLQIVQLSIAGVLAAAPFGFIAWALWRERNTPNPETDDKQRRRWNKR